MKCFPCLFIHTHTYQAPRHLFIGLQLSFFFPQGRVLFGLRTVRSASSEDSQREKVRAAPIVYPCIPSRSSQAARQLAKEAVPARSSGSFQVPVARSGQMGFIRAVVRRVNAADSAGIVGLARTGTTEGLLPQHARQRTLSFRTKKFGAAFLQNKQERRAP